tara:strand:+ start:117 stop:1769 length:1653 start_codon:yes stop_codon:yes gene_type:complete
MIKRIFIKNFAIINELELSIKNGLTVITGETGAGKSIILKALDIALGNKAEKTDVRSGQNQAVVEAETDLDGGLIYRRLVSKTGRMRSFINDEPISEPRFRECVEIIADFHGQHEQQFIMNSNTHIDFLDRFCSIDNKVLEIEFVYNNLIKIDQQLLKLKELSDNAATRKELLEFQLQEINIVDPQINEDIDLSQKFKRLNHIDELISTVRSLNQSLTEHEHSIYRQLSSSITDLEKLSFYDKSIKPFIESIEQAAVSIQDASSGLLQYAETIDDDPSLLKEIEERLHSIESLKRKYGGSIESVKAFIEEAIDELDQLTRLDVKISQNKEERKLLIMQYQRLADEIHKVRSKSIKTIEDEVQSALTELNMPGALFNISVSTKLDEDSLILFENNGVHFGPKGYDQVEFFFSANPGENPKPLIKIASGGEVSRIMLAIKSVLKKSDPVGTLVFDEIDTGISGQAAEKVSEALSSLSKEKQVICITHLPQIASKADHHLYVSKNISNDQTEVVANYLSEKEKVQAIAELFSGDTVTSQAITSAKQFRTEARG